MGRLVGATPGLTLRRERLGQRSRVRLSQEAPHLKPPESIDRDGDDLVVETNNLRGADEDSPYDGWLDVNGSPYTRQAKITERFRRPTLGHLQIDFTIEDPKAYTKPWTVRIDQRLLPDQELIEFVCNENQQFERRIQLDQEPASEPSSTP